MILGLDPGSRKTGWVFTDMDGVLLCSGIWQGSSEGLASIIGRKQWASLRGHVMEGSPDRLEKGKAAIVVLGKGTTSHSFMDFLQREGITPIHLVDESFTTLEARNLYWKIHKPGLLRRIFPFLRGFVPRDLDDLAAWVLVQRYLGYVDQ